MVLRHSRRSREVRMCCKYCKRYRSTGEKKLLDENTDTDS